MTPTPPNISIIIPTLNERQHLPACFESIRQNDISFDSLEILIVDGGSTDGTCDFVRDLETRYPNVHLLHNPGRIQSIAFNIGCRQAQGEIIIRLDAHALYCPAYIRLCYEYLTVHPEWGAVGGIWVVQPYDDTPAAKAIAALNRSSFGIGGAPYRVDPKPQLVDSVPYGAFRREVIQEVGPMREDLARGEDNEYFCRLRKAGYLVYMDPQMQITYYSRPTTRAHAAQMYANGLSIGQLFYVAPDSISLRHLVPMFFVIGLILCLPLPLLLYLPLALLAAYAAAGRDMRLFCTLPWLFLLTHVVYGWGTIVGLFMYRKQYKSTICK